MKKFVALMALALLAVVLAAVATTAGAETAAPAEKSASAPAPLTVVKIDAPNARAAALVDDTAVYIRKKGFRSITHPATGKYCLQLPKGLNAANIVANATPEYEYSPNTDISVQWDSVPDVDCPAGWTEFKTFTGTTAYSDQAFSVTIP